MKLKLLIFLFFFVISMKEGISQDFILQQKSIFNKLARTHDVDLPIWGPYSTKYAGVSHIANDQKGIIVSFSIFPRIYRGKVLVPNVNKQSDYYPWETSMDGRSYTFRNELVWKDKIYVDVSYYIVDSSTTFVELRYVNNTDLPQDLSLDLISYIEYPTNYSSYALLQSKEILWKNAIDYESMRLVKKHPDNNLVYNGWLRGEVRDKTLIDGRGIGKYFGRNKGDNASYQFNFRDISKKGLLAIRYKVKKNKEANFQLKGFINKKISFHGTNKFEWKVIPYHLTKKTVDKLVLESLNDTQITTLNGFMFIPSDKKLSDYLKKQKRNSQPKISLNENERNFIIKYRDIPFFYGVTWEKDITNVRTMEYRNDPLDNFFPERNNNYKEEYYEGNEKGNYNDIRFRQLHLDAHHEDTFYLVLSKGQLKEVKNRLKDIEKIKNRILMEKNNSVEKDMILPAGKKYLFSQKLLQATLMTNVMYPVYTQNEYIKNFTPGKYWPMLYTWDAGMITLGLNEMNLKLAAEFINTYTTSENSQSAFIEHGTPLPTQIFAFFDLWNKTQSENFLEYFYPRLKKFYKFLIEKRGSSTTNKFKSNLLVTWDYFYNSGGWDDYPAQVAVHKQHKEKRVAPVVTTAYNVRVAKMLRMVAMHLNKEKDVNQYNDEIKVLSSALQQYSWNVSSGYFSYVEHDKKGKPVGYFETNKGIDYNQGLDGVTPLVAGICTPVQQKQLFKKIFSKEHLWTDVGISTVDQSAPYFRTDGGGYWNGAVWFPHQWFLWKTMLDLGLPGKAYKIAKTALDVYKKETDATYNTVELFSAIKSQRGGGWHQFSGLSSPILNWFASYYKIGTVTPGFEIFINNQNFNNDYSSYRADIVFDNSSPEHSRSMLVCMNPENEYQVTFNGRKINVNSPYKGLLVLTFPRTNNGGYLLIKKF